MTVLLRGKESGNVLYAVAFEKYVNGAWGGDIIHLHAESIAHARMQFCLTHPNRKTHVIVAVGPAIGFYAEDDNGDKLTA